MTKLKVSEGTNGSSPPKPSVVRRVAATLLGQNKSSNAPTISIEVEACAMTIYRRGGGEESLRAFNGQWNSTSGLTTQVPTPSIADLA
jgi:hypothetical protein